MAETDKKTNSSLGATLWSLLMMVCMLLVVAHLVQAVSQDTASEEELINSTFTTAKPDATP
jgi:hypothetical protein